MGFCMFIISSLLSNIAVVQPVCLLQSSGFVRMSHEPNFEEWKAEQCDPATIWQMANGPDRFVRIREYDCKGNLLYITLKHGGTQLFSITAGPERELTDESEQAVDELLLSWGVTTLIDETALPKECRKLEI